MVTSLSLVPHDEPKTKEQKRAERAALFAKVQDAERQANAIMVHDDHSASVALVFVSGIRDLHDLMERCRDSEVRPLNMEVKAINDDYRPYTSLCKELGARVDQLVTNLRAKQRMELEEAQRKAIEDANKRRAEEEVKAAELRRQAEEAKQREQSDESDGSLVTVARKAYQNELERVRQDKAIARADGDDDTVLVLDAQEQTITGQIAALSGEVSVIDLEAQAQQAELRAATIAPAVVQQVQRTVTLPTGKKMIYVTSTVPVCLPGGLPLDGDYYRDDVRLKSLPDDLFILDVSRLKKRVKDGQKFIGVETREEEASKRGRK